MNEKDKAFFDDLASLFIKHEAYIPDDSAKKSGNPKIGIQDNIYSWHDFVVCLGDAVFKKVPAGYYKQKNIEVKNKITRQASFNIPIYIVEIGLFKNIVDRIPRQRSQTRNIKKEQVFKIILDYVEDDNSMFEFKTNDDRDNHIKDILKKINSSIIESGIPTWFRKQLPIFDTVTY